MQILSTLPSPSAQFETHLSAPRYALRNRITFHWRRIEVLATVALMLAHIAFSFFLMIPFIGAIQIGGLVAYLGLEWKMKKVESKLPSVVDFKTEKAYRETLSTQINQLKEGFKTTETKWATALKEAEAKAEKTHDQVKTELGEQHAKEMELLKGQMQRVEESLQKATQAESELQQQILGIRSEPEKDPILGNVLTQKEQEIARVRSEISTLKTQFESEKQALNHSSEQTIQELKNHHAEALKLIEKNLQQLKMHIEQEQKNLEAKTKECTLLTEQNQLALQSHLEALKIQKAEHVKLEDELRNQLQQSENRLNAKVQEYDLLKQDHLKREEQLNDQIKKQTEEVEKKSKQLEETQMLLHQEQNSQKATQEQLRQSTENLRKESDEKIRLEQQVKSEQETYVKSIDALKESRDRIEQQLREQLKKKEEEATQLNSALQAIQSKPWENASILSLVGDHLKIAVKTQQDIQFLETKKSALEKELNAKTNRLDETQKLIAESEKKLKALASAVKQQKDALKQLKS